MGGGSWDTDTYKQASISRAAKGVDDFDYSRTATTIHANLEPARINRKPFGKLESRDSDEHPESNAVLVTFDVTGSNVVRAREAQKALPKLMELLRRYLPDPQVAVAANDDYEVQPDKCTQISDFESDIRVDEHLRNLVLVGDGGGNSKESYDLLLYAAARKTILDCKEKRGRKGYMFMYADEPLYPAVSKAAVKDVFGDDIQGDIPIRDIIAEVRESYYLYLISTVTPVYGAATQYRELFGDNWVLTLQNPSMICELIASVVGLNEERVTGQQAVADLVSMGTSEAEAQDLVAAAAPKVARTRTLPALGEEEAGATRL